MKKTITYLIIVILLFNFILCNHSYASSPDTEKHDSAYESQANTSNTVVADIVEEGAVERKQDAGTKTTLSLGSFGLSAVGMVTGILARLINVFVVQIDFILGVLTVTETTDGNEFWFSIDRAVFNRVALFNINYFDTADTYNVGETTITANSSNIAIKKGITDVYYMCRILALVLVLLVLIYIGIRMAISTVASEEARYKKMFISWIESVVIIFLMLYIISMFFTLGETLTGVFYNLRNDLIGTASSSGAEETFEDTIRTETWNNVKSLSGLNLTMWSIIYWCFLFMEVKFFWLYIKRLLMVGLLIIISPLITITYSIDKAGDGRAQVFSSWMQEFVVNVLIQPLHALIYLVFVVTANTIAKESPLVALALLMAMGAVERMVKVVFNMKGLATLRGVDKFLKKEG